MLGDSWYVRSAPAFSRRVRASRPQSTEMTGSTAPCPIATRGSGASRSIWKPGHARHEAREREEPGGPRSACSEAERVGHHRSLREASQHRPLGRSSDLGGEVVEPRRRDAKRLGERRRVRVADLLDRVPVRASGRKVERAARRHAVHSSPGSSRSSSGRGRARRRRDRGRGREALRGRRWPASRQVARESPRAEGGRRRVRLGYLRLRLRSATRRSSSA